MAAADESGVSGDLPRLVRDLTAPAVAAGHGGNEIAALIETFRRS